MLLCCCIGSSGGLSGWPPRPACQCLAASHGFPHPRMQGIARAAAGRLLRARIGWPSASATIVVKTIGSGGAADAQPSVSGLPMHSMRSMLRSRFWQLLSTQIEPRATGCARAIVARRRCGAFVLRASIFKDQMERRPRASNEWRADLAPRFRYHHALLAFPAADRLRRCAAPMPSPAPANWRWPAT